MTDRSVGSAPGEGFDVVGIGAFNLDVLAGLRVSREQLRAVAGVDIGWGAETAVTEDVIARLLRLPDPDEITVSPGGSTLNALFALAHVRPRLRVAALGLAGTSPSGTVCAVTELARAGVDVSMVGRSPRPPGTCLALGHDDGERTLLTCPGANQDAAGHLRDLPAGQADLLARTRVLHLTSFLDPATPEVLLDLLGAAHRSPAGPVLVIDPGHVWCAAPEPAVIGLLALADVMIVNRAELALLAGHLGAVGQIGEGGRAQLLLRSVADPAHRLPGGPVVLVKKPTGVGIHRADGVREVTHTRLAPTEIVDSTGAGDVFAAGVLAALAEHGPSPAGESGPTDPVEAGARWGLALARSAMRCPGGWRNAPQNWSADQPGQPDPTD